MLMKSIKGNLHIRKMTHFALKEVKVDEREKKKENLTVNRRGNFFYYIVEISNKKAIKK